MKWLSVKLGKISYQIFLLQHVIIYRVVNLHTPSNECEYWLMLFVAVIITITLAEILFVVTKKALQSSVFMDFERYICNVRSNIEEMEGYYK